HFGEYGLLGGLLFRAFRAGHPRRWRLNWAVYSLVVAGSWAVLDELHQTFTVTRGGSIWDSVLDSSGALFTLVVIYLYIKRREAQEAG
ncbi:MAG: VanZ family protein, partial [Blastocatellia bacterium]